MPSREVLVTVAEKLLKGRERYGVTVDDCLDGGDTPALVERRAKELLRREIIKAEKKSPRPRRALPQKAVEKVQSMNNGDYDGRGIQPAEMFAARHREPLRQIHVPLMLEQD